MAPDAPLAPDEPEIMRSPSAPPDPPALAPPPPRPPGHARARLGSLRRLSDRTSLRTKLITAVLALVIAALAAISITSVWVLRNYLTTQYDSTLQNAYQAIVARLPGDLNGAIVNIAYPVGHQPNLYAGIELPGS